MPKHKVSLQDRYTQLEGRVHLRGSLAMIRLLFMQRLRDERVKLNTAGFVSGYRGSPMTAIDQELWRAGQLLPGILGRVPLRPPIKSPHLEQNETSERKNTRGIKATGISGVVPAFETQKN